MTPDRRIAPELPPPNNCPFVGRDQELKSIMQVVRILKEQGPVPTDNLFIVAGLPGAGARALVEEACNRIGGDTTVAHIDLRSPGSEEGYNPRYTNTPPFLLRDIIEKLAGENPTEGQLEFFKLCEQFENGTEAKPDDYDKTGKTNPNRFLIFLLRKFSEQLNEMSAQHRQQGSPLVIALTSLAARQDGLLTPINGRYNLESITQINPYSLEDFIKEILKTNIYGFVLTDFPGPYSFEERLRKRVITLGALELGQTLELLDKMCPNIDPELKTPVENLLTRLYPILQGHAGMTKRAIEAIQTSIASLPVTSPPSMEWVINEIKTAYPDPAFAKTESQKAQLPTFTEMAVSVGWAKPESIGEILQYRNIPGITTIHTELHDEFPLIYRISPETNQGNIISPFREVYEYWLKTQNPENYRDLHRAFLALFEGDRRYYTANFLPYLYHRLALREVDPSEDPCDPLELVKSSGLYSDSLFKQLCAFGNGAILRLLTADEATQLAS